MIMLKLHKFAIETSNSIDIVSSSYYMLVALVVVRPYSFRSNPAHGYQAMNGKYQQPNYYADVVSLRHKTYSVNQYTVFKKNKTGENMEKWC